MVDIRPEEIDIRKFTSTTNKYNPGLEVFNSMYSGRVKRNLKEDRAYKKTKHIRHSYSKNKAPITVSGRIYNCTNKLSFRKKKITKKS